MSGLAGDARRRAAPGSSLARRAWSWLAWWIVLMATWVIVDYSISIDELLAGAGAAVLAAFLVEVASWQAAVRFGARTGWLVPALRLPGQVLAGTATVFAALGLRLLRTEPRSGFLAEPVTVGPDTPEGKLRRAVLVGEQSLAPNKFVLGIDADRGVMVVHKLVLDEGEWPR
jgi:multisubunit Na+/H+ antiporter MnhE subunit